MKNDFLIEVLAPLKGEDLVFDLHWRLYRERLDWGQADGLRTNRAQVSWSGTCHLMHTLVSRSKGREGHSSPNRDQDIAIARKRAIIVPR
jgi:hypothetical protein